MEKYKIQLNYGSLAGIIYFALFYFYYSLGKNPLGMISWLSVWVPVLFIYLGIKNIRDQADNGFISYGKALKSGIFISFVFSSLFGILFYMFGNFVDSSVIQMFIDEVVQGLTLAESYLSEEMFNNMRETVEVEIKEMTLANIAWGEFQNKFLGGIVLSLIIAAFLKNNPTPFDSPILEKQENES